MMFDQLQSIPSGSACLLREQYRLLLRIRVLQSFTAYCIVASFGVVFAGFNPYWVTRCFVVLAVINQALMLYFRHNQQWPADKISEVEQHWSKSQAELRCLRWKDLFMQLITIFALIIAAALLQMRW